MSVWIRTAQCGREDVSQPAGKGKSTTPACKLDPRRQGLQCIQMRSLKKQEITLPWRPAYTSWEALSTESLATLPNGGPVACV